MARRKNRLLVPESREEVNAFKTRIMNEVLGTNIQQHENVKMEVAKQLDIPFKKEGNGSIRAEDAGKIGGVIGGTMVKEMIRLAQQSLADQQDSDG